MKPDYEWRDRGDGCWNPKPKRLIGLIAVIFIALLLSPFAYFGEAK